MLEVLMKLNNLYRNSLRRVLIITKKTIHASTDSESKYGFQQNDYFSKRMEVDLSPNSLAHLEMSVVRIPYFELPGHTNEQTV